MEKLLKVSGLCELLNISKTTAHKYIKTEEIPFVRIGREYRFQESKIERWLGEQTSKQQKEKDKKLRPQRGPKPKNQPKL